MSRDIVFDDVSSLHQWCIDVVEEEYLQFKITDTNDFNMVLEKMRNSFGRHTVGQYINDKFIAVVITSDAVSPDCTVYVITAVYVFLTETDDDKLLITLTTDRDIEP